MLDLTKALNVKPEDYAECLDSLSHGLTCPCAPDANLNFHYVIPDGDGEPKFQHLAEMLAAYIIHYCLDAKRRTNLDPVEAGKLFIRARDLFRKYSRSGQAGEILLYFLLEAVTKAPQVLQKMPITTNANEERKGSDGLHARWDIKSGMLNVYFCESKIYDDFARALRKGVESIEKFHAGNMRKHEFFLAGYNLRAFEKHVQEELGRYLAGALGTKTRTFYACLVGYDWKEYERLDDTRRLAFLTEFQKRYSAEAGSIAAAVDDKLKKSKISHLGFEFFFVPFKKVEDFRNWFQQALTGME